MTFQFALFVVCYLYDDGLEVRILYGIMVVKNSLVKMLTWKELRFIFSLEHRII